MIHPHVPIINLRHGLEVRQYFLVRSAETRTAKNGQPFLALVLADKTATIPARVWSEVLAKCSTTFARGQEVAIRGKVKTFNEALQIEVDSINTVEALRTRGHELQGYDPEQLYPATTYDRQQMWQELRHLAEAQLQAPLQQLVLSLLSRYESGFLAAPAARVYHHPYLGGLLEHTWFVARHALATLAIYPDLDHSLTLAGAILHDLGKVKEIANPTAPELTVSGQLLGHIVLGWEMVREEARKLDFPDAELLLELEHIILAHHGAIEFGSPVPPKTREALLVYFRDDLDAKLKMMSTHLQSDAGDGDFTSYHRVLGRGFYKGARNATADKNSEK